MGQDAGAASLRPRPCSSSRVRDAVILALLGLIGGKGSPMLPPLPDLDSNQETHRCARINSPSRCHYGLPRKVVVLQKFWRRAHRGTLLPKRGSSALWCGSGSSGSSAGRLLVVDVLLDGLQWCSAAGDDGVGRGPEVLAPECVADFGPVMCPDSHGRDGFQGHDQDGQCHLGWIGHQEMRMVSVGLEGIQSGTVPSAYFLERYAEFGAHSVSHDVPSVFRGQHDVCMEPIDHMSSSAPIAF